MLLFAVNGPNQACTRLAFFARLFVRGDELLAFAAFFTGGPLPVVMSVNTPACATFRASFLFIDALKAVRSAGFLSRTARNVFESHTQ